MLRADFAGDTEGRLDSEGAESGSDRILGGAVPEAGGRRLGKPKKRPGSEGGAADDAGSRSEKANRAASDEESRGEAGLDEAPSRDEDIDAEWDDCDLDRLDRALLNAFEQEDEFEPELPDSGPEWWEEED